MIGKFSGEEVCACGFSIGFERIIAVLRDANVTSLDDEEAQGSTAFLIDAKASAEQRRDALERAQELRFKGGKVAVVPMRKNMKRQIQSLEAEGFDQFEKIYAR